MQNGSDMQMSDAATALVNEARSLTRALPADDAVAAVRQITAMLTAIHEAAAVSPVARYEAINLLEAPMIEHTRSLLREYLDTTRHTRQREADIWLSAHHAWRALADAHALCLCQHAEHPAVSGFQGYAPVCAARAIRALRRQLQWQRVRYLPPAPELWQRLAAVYLQAEATGLTQELAIYPGESTTQQRELLKLLALAILSGENLTPREHELTTFLVNYYAHHFLWSHTPRPGCTHSFDLKNPQPPLRASGAPRPNADLRYFGVGGAIAELEGMVNAVEHKHDVPASLGFKRPIDPVFLAPVLNQIYLEWSGEKLDRDQERETVSTRLSVVPGFKAVIGVLEKNVADPLDFTAQQRDENWVVSDVSEHGFGVVMPAVTADWVSVGSVVGIEDEAAGRWAVGIVRRVRRIEGGQQHIGVRVLTRNAQAVRVMRESPLGQNGRITQRMPIDQGILLTDNAAQQREIELLVSDAALYGAEDFHMLAGDQVLLVRLREVLEIATDCTRVRFTVRGAET